MEVVLIHSVLWIASQIKIWRVHVRVMGGLLQVAPATNEWTRKASLKQGMRLISGVRGEAT